MLNVVGVVVAGVAASGSGRSSDGLVVVRFDVTAADASDFFVSRCFLGARTAASADASLASLSRAEFDWDAGASDGFSEASPDDLADTSDDLADASADDEESDEPDSEGSAAATP